MASENSSSQRRRAAHVRGIREARGRHGQWRNAHEGLRRRRTQPQLRRHVGLFAARQHVGTTPGAARELADDETVARRLGSEDAPVADLVGLLHQVLEVLEGVFEPVHARQRQRHVDADFQERVAHRDPRAHVGREPADAHHVGYVAMDIEQIADARFEQLALAARIEIFAGIDQRGSALILDELEAREIVAQDRVFDPVDVVSRALHEREVAHRLLGSPGLVGVHHDERVGADDFFQDGEAMQVTLHLRVSHLDLERAESLRRRLREQPFELLVAQVEVEPAGIGLDLAALRA